MKKIASLFVSAAAATTLLFNSVSAQESKKVVLLEQYTGAWCGWCVEGTTFMNDLEAEYGDRFIGVKIHQGDDMQNNTIWSQIGSLISGFPSGGVDRSSVGGTVAIDRGQWKSAVESRLNTEPSVDVQVKEMKYDPSTRLATITVSGKVLKEVTGELRFSLYIIEDSVSGTGSGYDQQNYLSGNANFKSNEYYSKPKVIYGYQHMSVVRDILGGVLGQTNSFPAQATVGNSYDYTFTYFLPAGFKAWNTKAVASVYRYRSSNLAQNEILNATETETFSTLPLYKIEGLAQNFGFTTQSGMVSGSDVSSKSIAFNNVSDEPVTLNLIISNSSILPQEWNVSLKENKLTVPAKSSKEVMVDVKSNSFASCQPIEITAIPEKDGMQGVPTVNTFWVLSDNARGGVFYGAAANNLAASSMAALKKDPNFESVSVFIPLAPLAMKNFDFSKLDIGVFDLGQYVIDQPSTDGMALDAVKQLLDNNKKVYITGERLITNNQDGNYFTQECMDFYEKTLGVTLNEMKQRYAGNTLISFKINGIENDPISDGVNVTANNAASSTNPTYSLFTESHYMLPDTKSVPILYFDNDMDAIAGVRMEDGDKRIVYLGFNPMCIANTTIRERLISDAYTWLMNGSATSAEDLDNALANAFATPNPISGSNVTLSFDATVDGTSTFTVMNTLGQKVMTFDGNVQNGKNNVNLNVNSLTSGSYTVSAVIGGRTLRIPFIVTK